MSQHDHSHGKDHHNHHEHHHESKGGFHRSPIFWVAVVLMLAGMFAYVATMDEALGPDGQVNQEVPAAAE